MTEPTAYEGLAVVELMGHRMIGGEVREVTQYGTQMLSVDVWDSEGNVVATQFYGGNSIYCITPCDEAAAKRVASQTWRTPEIMRLALPEHREIDEGDYQK